MLKTRDVSLENTLPDYRKFLRFNVTDATSYVGGLR
jgi:hypothetical protein